jgi:YaaC-like protein
MFEDLEYVGSFQDRRFTSRTGNPLHAIWREIARIGTTDNLARTAVARGVAPSSVTTASLRFQQGIELRNAAIGAGALSRPLLLYYSCLNLLRGTLLVFNAGMGQPLHGATFKQAADIFACAAEIGAKGTISQMLAIFGKPSSETKGQRFTVEECLAQMTELRRDYDLLGFSRSRAVVPVHVHAFMSGRLELTYFIPSMASVEFSDGWRQLLPWFADTFELHPTKEKTLVAKAPHRSYEVASSFCQEHLWADMHVREEPVWFDQLSRDGAALLPRIMPYVLFLFILSNVCRYEPEILNSVLSETSDRAFVLTEAINACERYFPQLLLSLSFGTTIYFE